MDIIVPGADWSAAPGRIGSSAYLARNFSALANINSGKADGLAGPAMWATAARATAGFTWLEEIAGRVFTPEQPGFMPTLTTVSGEPFVDFNGAGVRVAKEVQTVGDYSYVFVLYPTSVTTGQGLISRTTTDTAGERISINAAGGLSLSRVGSSTVSSNAGLLTANTTAIVIVSWDGTNGAGFSKNGVFDRYQALAGPAQRPTDRIVLGGLDQTNVSGYTGYMGDVMHFPRNLHLPAYAAERGRLLRRLGTQYGVAVP